MNDVALDRENRLKAAENRLTQAILRLETAMAGQSSERSDVAELKSHVQNLIKENNELRDLVSVSVDKLDGAIGQFKTMLTG